MNMWHEISAGKDVPEVINVIVECPKGTKNKYEIDKETGLIKLDRAMKTSQDYPFDYGFVPQTLWEDNDALDVILLTTNPLAPSILVEARPIGLMKMIDGGEGDDKVIAVPKSDPRWDHIKDLKDVNPYTLKEMRHFYETYKTIENKTVEINGFKGRKDAIAAVKKGLKLYRDKYGKKA
jgi:inorganic pyrophosphatase